jgi:hypothetical protein
VLAQVALVTLLPGLVVGFLLPQVPRGTGSWVALLAATTLLGYWLLGVSLAGLITFGEFLLGTLRDQAEGSSDSVGGPLAPGFALPSSREGARSLGGGSRRRKSSQPGA